MEPFFLKNEQYFLIENWQKDSLIAGFTTKNGGVSTGPFSTFNLGFHVNDSEAAVRRNRELLGENIDFPMNCWIGAEQVHDNRIMIVGKRERGKGAGEYETSIKETDGFFTKEKGVLLTLSYADCVPLYFYAPKHDAIGIAHAGWRGSVKGISAEMVELFKNEGIAPRDIFVVIGPAICENCYVVNDHVIDFVQKRLENVEEKPYNLITGNQFQLDLKKLNRLVLENSSIVPEHISVSNLCTSCEQDFFSHRRDKGKTGRMMSFIGWKED